MPAMRLLNFRRLLPAAAVAIALLLAPARPGHGQDPPPPGSVVHGDGEWISNPTSIPTPAVFATTPVTGTERVYLPLIARPPSVRIQFGSAVDGQNNLIDPGITFAYGITHLYYSYTVEDAPGQVYRTEWSIDGVRQPLLDESGTIPSEALATFASHICSPTLGPCGVPLPRGAYQVKFFIDNVFRQEATATIQ
jgi:hypothetical protein